jgi:hypothetical protein
VSKSEGQLEPIGQPQLIQINHFKMVKYERNMMKIQQKHNILRPCFMSWLVPQLQKEIHEFSGGNWQKLTVINHH